MSFGGILRQSTATDVLIGPFVDSTDGDAEETGLTIAQADVRLSKNGQTGAQKNDATSAAHDADGFYNCELDATDTNTVGQLTLYVHVAGALAVRHDYQIIEEAVYDISFAAAATGAVPSVTGAVGSVTGAVGSIASGGIAAASFAAGAVNAAAIANGAIDAATFAAGAIDATAIASGALTLAKVATDLREAFGLNLTGTLSGTHSDTTADLGTNAPANDISGQTLFFPDHDLSRLVASYNTGTGVATFESIGVTLVDGNTWYLTATAPGASGSGLDAAGVRAAVGLATANLDTQLSAIDTVVDSILVDTAEIGAAGAGLTALATQTSVNDLPTNAELATALGTADDAVLAAVAALNNLSAAQVATELATYDGPTNAEMVARTLAAAEYATAENLATVDTVVDQLNSGIIYGAAATGTLSTTQASTNLTGYGNDQLIGRVVTFLSGACEGESTDITDYVETNGVLTFTALTTAPGNGDTFKIT